MSCTEVRHGTDHICTAIVCQTAWNDLQRLSNCSVGVLATAFNAFGLLLQSGCELHFNSSTAGQQKWFEENVSGYSKGILQVALDFIQHIPCGTSQNDGTSFGILALRQEGEIFFTKLLHLESSTPGAHHVLLKFLCTIANVGSSDAGNAVVVRFPDAADHGAATLHQEMLSQIRDALLGDDQVRFHFQDVVTDASHLFLLLLQELFPVGFFGDLDIGLTFALLVLQGAV
mmetsp:Transcript_105015/g.146424  ORF Transcript_105015/g.146424 Transcript_105015/m.146424 type:complete len:230 (-) Transcript_105015:806-1495(-)